MTKRNRPNADHLDALDDDGPGFFRPNPTGDGTTEQIKSPRDSASGQATGIMSPRDSASGLPTGIVDADGSESQFTFQKIEWATARFTDGDDDLEDEPEMLNNKNPELNRYEEVAFSVADDVDVLASVQTSFGRENSIECLTFDDGPGDGPMGDTDDSVA